MKLIPRAANVYKFNCGLWEPALRKAVISSHYWQYIQQTISRKEFCLKYHLWREAIQKGSYLNGFQIVRVVTGTFLDISMTLLLH